MESVTCDNCIHLTREELHIENPHRNQETTYYNLCICYYTIDSKTSVHDVLDAHALRICKYHEAKL